MDQTSISWATKREYSRTKQPYAFPEFHPEAGVQLQSLADIRTQCFRKLPITLMEGKVKYQFGDNPPSRDIDNVLPGGADSWILSGFYAREGKLVLQFLPLENEQLYKLADSCQSAVENIYDIDSESAYDAESEYTAAIYRLFAVEIIATGFYKLQFDLGFDQCVVVSNKTTYFDMTEIETGVYVRSYHYDRHDATATVINYCAN